MNRKKSTEAPSQAPSAKFATEKANLQKCPSKTTFLELMMLNQPELDTC